MGDWLTERPEWKAPLPCPRAKPRQSKKDARITELEEQVRRLKREIEQIKTDHALMDPKTGRPRPLTCRAGAWPIDKGTIRSS